MADFPMVYAWRNNPVRAALYGRRCRVVCSGRMYSSLIEFEDGSQVVTSRRAVRRPKGVGNV